MRARVDLLIDVRRYPSSRGHPHFSRDRLSVSLTQHGMAYAWWGETLGGRRKPESRDDHHIAWRNASFRAYAGHMDTPTFRGSLDSLESRSASSDLVIMCAETLWWRCHRRLIADALVADGFEVVHLGLGDDRSHALTPTVRVLENGMLVYDKIPSLSRHRSNRDA
jgi:uncharacterized protein (DUF488 family)